MLPHAAATRLVEEVLHGARHDAVMLVAAKGVLADDVLPARHGVRLARACDTKTWARAVCVEDDEEEEARACRHKLLPRMPCRAVHHPTCQITRTRLAVCKYGHVVTCQRCVEQLVDAAQVHDLCLADVRAQACVEAKVTLHRRPAWPGHHHLQGAAVLGNLHDAGHAFGLLLWVERPHPHDDLDVVVVRLLLLLVACLQRLRARQGQGVGGRWAGEGVHSMCWRRMRAHAAVNTCMPHQASSRPFEGIPPNPSWFLKAPLHSSTNQPAQQRPWKPLSWSAAVRLLRCCALPQPGGDRGWTWAWSGCSRRCCRSLLLLLLQQGASLQQPASRRPEAAGVLVCRPRHWCWHHVAAGQPR